MMGESDQNFIKKKEVSVKDAGLKVKSMKMHFSYDKKIAKKW